MRDYEVVYIFRSTLSEEEIESRLDRYHGVIEEDGEVSAVEHWGKRQLSYPIRKQDNGYYVVAQFSTEPELLAEFERQLKLDEDLLRHLVVLSEGELPIPSTMRGEDEDEEDEEDEDEEEDEGEDEDEEEDEEEDEDEDEDEEEDEDDEEDEDEEEDEEDEEDEDDDARREEED